MCMLEEGAEYDSLPKASLGINMMAGALAGMAEHSLMYPIDSIKTRMQVVATVGNGGGATATLNVARPFPFIATSEGVMALWRGINSVIIGAGPAHAVYFATYEKCKELLGGNNSSHFSIHAMSGAMATVAADGLMNPFDVVKQRMQLPCSLYKGIFDCARTIFQKEGLSAFYVSYPTTLCLNIPFQSIHFASYEYLRRTLNPSGVYDPLSYIIAGGGAGAIAASITNPIDVAKTLLQTRGSSELPEVRQAQGIRSAFQIILKHSGIRGLYRGITARVLTHMPANAISWTTYEFLKMLFHQPSTSLATTP